MREIRGDAKNIRTLLSGAKFAIDYYQREFRWEKKQVTELINDLCEKFLESHEIGNERSAVEGYGHYFLGSIIISDKDGQKFIIDGQQRLTSLTLLLIHIYRQIEDDEQKGQLAELIFSQRYGERSFNLDVTERAGCMNSLFNGQPFEEADQPESVENILNRYQDIEECFPEYIETGALPFFADWFIENVHLVEITAYSDTGAYTIFETMNDRGLSLTPTDMLKGFAFYTRWYERLRKAAETRIDGLEMVHYNARNNFTLQYPVLLAPILRTDDEEEALIKVRIVAAYIDILIARRIWNWKSTSYSAMQYNMFQLVILNIRGKSATELARILTQRLDAEEETFSSNERFSLHGMNRPQVHHLLARITDFIEIRSGRQSRYNDYIHRGKNGYEVEHIWANHAHRYDDEFNHPTDFSDYRNHIGGLLLLPKSFNASYGDMPYNDKREHYYGQNLLAQSPHEKAYEHDPGFCRFMGETGLAFQPHMEFKKADMDARQELYRALAEEIWNPENLSREVDP